MTEYRPTTPWTTLAGKHDATNPRATVRRLVDDFIDNFGDFYGISLSYGAPSGRTVIVQNKAVPSILQGQHAFLTLDDVPTVEECEFIQGAAKVPFSTNRLLQMLEYYATERVFELIDPRKVTVQVDTDSLADTEEKVFTILHDYIHAGIISWPQGRPLPSLDAVQTRLEIAWGDTRQLYRTQRESSKSSGESHR